jgi:cytochrome b6-f complex iron-sulfur subunit
MTEQEKSEANGAPADEAAAEAVAGADSDTIEAKRPARGAAAPAGPDHAVVLPQREPGSPVVTRRRVLQMGFWASMGAAIAGMAACGVDLLYPRNVIGFGGVVSAGDVSLYPPGSKTQVPEGRFWLVHLTEEQGGPGLLALWWKCPHLGCTVPWRPTFIWPDEETGAPKQGWFRCPCHGSTYTDAGVRVFGPAPRSMDTMAITIDGGRISVNTGSITNGAPDNPDRAVRV